MKLLLDQELPRSAAALLRATELDADHVGDRGYAAASDAAILALAEAEGRVVVTLDADFHTLLALAGATAPSIIRIRIEGLRAEALLHLIQTVLAQTSAELTLGAVVTVQEGRLRLRRLPLTP